MHGLMQDRPLLISQLVEYAGRYHADQELVTRTIEGPIARQDFATFRLRARKLAVALRDRLGLAHGDRVGSLAFNTARHLEMFYGVSGAGYVLHTINPRLFPEQVAYIVNHAEDRWLFADLACWPLVEALGAQLKVAGYVVMTDRAHMPATALANVLCYEDLIDEADEQGFVWPEFDENTASALCYTSGTTGNPKGALYSHRSTLLCALTSNMSDSLGMRGREVIMPIAPLFHAAGWMLPYSIMMTGTKFVMPGRHYEPENLYRLMEDEGVTLTAAVPTVWMMLMSYLEQTGQRFSHLKRVVIGGSAPSPAMLRKLERDYGIECFQAWGMTETMALGTKGTLKPAYLDLPWEEQAAFKQMQGRAVCGVELKLIDDEGQEVPQDGVQSGHLLARGPWIAKAYFKGEGGDAMTADGWFRTGDVAKIRPDGYLVLTDRSKDVIKSGGEWISSIDLENIAVGHPEIAEAAVIAAKHPKWDERPLLVAVRKPGSTLTSAGLIEWMADKVAKWWLPDDVVFVDQLPHTATGKLAKVKLREQFRDYVLPGASAAVE